MKCTEIMTINPKVCVPEDEVSTAANIMWDHDCGAVPVVKDQENKELVGIVTDRDIAMHVARHAYIHPSQVIVGDCMSCDVATCNPDDPLDTAMQLMRQRKVRRVPIIDQNGSCVGIISQADLLSKAGDIGLPVIDTLQWISIHGKEEQEDHIESNEMQ
jgi:CBS domain-containing protein